MVVYFINSTQFDWSMCERRRDGKLEADWLMASFRVVFQPSGHAPPKAIHLQPLARARSYMSSNSGQKSRNLSSSPTSSGSEPVMIKKPPISYAAMIAQALMESPDGRLALPEIYSWIQGHYEYYRLASPAWKNSIRHNLSMNRAFCKAEPPPDAAFKCSYWQFAVPTRVKVGSKGKATVSTTVPRRRSRSVSGVSGDGYEKNGHNTSRRSSDSMAPIRPRPSVDFCVNETREDYSSLDMTFMLNPDTSSTSSSTVIMLSSSDGSSPARDETVLDSVQSFYSFPSPVVKSAWTPPPGDLEEAFHFSHDPLIPTQNIRSPMMR